METRSQDTTGSGQSGSVNLNDLSTPHPPTSPTLPPPRTPTNPSTSFPPPSQEHHPPTTLSANPNASTSTSTVSASPSLKLQTSTPPQKNGGMVRSNSGGLNVGSQSPSSPARSPNGNVDVESVLRQYGGDTKRALEAMINERNNFSAQNNQLWKLMEKSRSQGSVMFKEAERMRGERDRAVMQLSQLGHTLAPSTSSASTSTAESSQMPTSNSLVGLGVNESRSERSRKGSMGSMGDANTNKDLPPPIIRHSSDTPDRPSHVSRIHTPPSPASVALLEIANGSAPPIPRRGSDERGLQLKNPQRLAKSPEITGPGESPKSPETGVKESAIVAAATSSGSPALDLPFVESTKPPPRDISAGTTAEVSEPAPTATAIPSTNSTITQSTTSLLPPAPISQPVTTTANREAESRMSFDPDVKQYLAMMSTPVASPQEVEFPPQQASGQGTGHQLSPVQEVMTPHTASQNKEFAVPSVPAPSMRAPPNQPPFSNTTETDALPPVLPISPFFSSDGSSVQTRSLQPESELGTPEPLAPVGFGAEMQAQQRLAMSGGSESPNGGVSGAGSSSSLPISGAFDDIPPRRPSVPDLPEVKPLALRSRQPPVRQDSTSSTVDDSRDQEPLTRPPTYESSRPPPAKQPQTARFPQQRLPRLTPQLLPYVRCQVTSSTITTNALGKDVLCFVISVSLRPPGVAQVFVWGISKLFSAFMDLDTRVKNALGGKREAKNAGIASLPDGKTWKDFAPSKIDQRKATLENYLQSLLTAAMENKDDICGFLQSDFYQAQAKAGNADDEGSSKSGYLTKKGKSLGGWKTRFFSLEGSSLHYYEARGGAKLGTIPMLGAQIGRQHKSGSEQPDDKSYRHAFLIIEAKRSGAGSQTRHVLCAQSDEERDSWVEVLIRHVNLPQPPAGPSSNGGAEKQPWNDDRKPELARASTSSSMASDITKRPEQPVRNPSKEDIPVVRGSARPIANLPHDDSNAKLFQSGVPPAVINARENAAARHSPQSSIASMPNLQDPALSASLPKDLERTLLANQEQQRFDQARATKPPDYPVLEEPTPLRSKRQSMMPPPRAPMLENNGRDRQAQPAVPGPSRAQRVASTMYPPPERLQNASPDRVQRDKISAPTGGVPIPTGFKFGAKGPGEISNTDRERKAKSGRFWGFGGITASKPGSSAVATPVPRPVFGVHLEESLQIAQVAGLPAIVFRCIQYLEASAAAQEEGIFRLSGSSAVIKGLRERFNTEGDIDLLGNDEKWDLHAIAGLLKLFLRELPTSLLTRELHMKFLAVMDLVNSEERVTELSSLVSELPEANYTLLRALTSHLILVIANAHINKMTMRNIGVIFSPTLGIPAGIFSELVSHFQAIFDDDESTPSPEVDGIPPSASQASVASTAQGIDESSQNPQSRNRNSKLYAASGVDKLLGTQGRSLPVQDDDSDMTDEPFASDRESMAPSSITSTPIPGITLNDQEDEGQVVTMPDDIFSLKISRPSSPGLPSSPRLNNMTTPTQPRRPQVQASG